MSAIKNMCQVGVYKPDAVSDRRIQAKGQVFSKLFLGRKCFWELIVLLVSPI